jgi:hypothetical protein
MKIKDGLYRYPGLGGTMARAHLRVYDHEGSVVAIVGELTDNPSTSITGSAGRVCYLLRTEYGPGVIVIQYHPGSKATWSTVISPPGTKPAWGPLTQPAWGPLTQAEAEMLAGEPLKTWAEADYTIANLTGKGPV